MMNDGADLVKAGVEAALRPLNTLIEKLVGPAAEELGFTWQDSIKVFRFGRRLRLMQRVNDLCEAAGIDPKRVPLKLLLPIVENASVEEDDSLQDIWANLLANAADGHTNASEVLPSFSAILSALTARDVKFLDALYSEEVQTAWGSNQRDQLEESVLGLNNLLMYYAKAKLAQGTWIDLPTTADWEANYEFEDDRRGLMLIVDVLAQHGLLRVTGSSFMVNAGPIDTPHYTLTYLGWAFVAACRPPRKAV
jgi:hypothetical protein